MKNRICFVCLGNICRSPMAEYMLKDKLRKRNILDKYLVASKATSYEEEGNDLYPPAKEKLREKGIPFDRHYASKVEKEDIDKYDYFICMEDKNIMALKAIIGDSDKIFKLLDRDISDPWYTGEFEKTYRDLDEGLELLINSLLKRGQ